MTKKLLITRPKHDLTTHYLFYWAKKIIELATSKGIPVFDLSKQRANKKEVTSILNKREPGLVFFNGHGRDNCIAGNDDEVLIEAGKNDHLMRSKIVYSRSCRSGKTLGPQCIRSGALVFLGYEQDFVFFTDKNMTNRPLRDNTARLFLEPSNHVIIGLLKGHSAKESHKRSVKIFRENISKVANSESPDNYLIPYLLWDMRHQVCLGDKNAYFH